MLQSTKRINLKSRGRISDKQAGQLVLRSNPDCEIRQLSLFQKSLLFSELSLVSYLSLEQCNIAAGKLGFTPGQFFESSSSQACWFQNSTDSVVVFRGIEAHQWKDIEADANALTVIAETVGKVHRGFKKEVDELWPHIEQALQENTKTLWFTGHSLGGAMATICAGRCLLSHIKSEPEGLYTFGSPRVGDRRYVNYTGIPHIRWVNNNDIVTRVPPVWLGYRHGGQEMYLDQAGNLRDVTGWRRVSDRLQGLVKELRSKFRIDFLADHSITDYVDRIFDLVRREEIAGGKVKSASSKSAPSKSAPSKSAPSKSAARHKAADTATPQVSKNESVTSQ